MPLPINFQFSQNNLQDYVDCPKRFELRHLLRQPWPALISEPVLEQERHMKLGSRFHEIVHQLFSGVPADLITTQIEDSQLLAWWQAFLTYSPLPAGTIAKHTEVSLSAGFQGVRLIAKYDLLAYTSDNQAVILDWKTSQKLTSIGILKARIQTRLYPFLLTLSGRFPDGSAIQPANVKMIFWFTNFPQQPVIIQYSPEQFNQDQAEISTFIGLIQATPPGKFILTQNKNLCAFCVYRSLCDRGAQAGNWAEADLVESGESESLSLNFDQIAEAEF